MDLCLWARIKIASRVVFKDKPNPMKVVRKREELWTKWSPVSSVKLVMWQLFHFSIVGRYTTVCLPEVLGEIRKTNKRRGIIVHQDNASSHISSKQRVFDRQNRRIDGSSAVHPCFGTQWLTSISVLEVSQSTIGLRALESVSTIGLRACKGVQI